MHDDGKTKRQLLEELALLRAKVAELEGAAGAASGAEITAAPKKRKRPAFKPDAAAVTVPTEIDALLRFCFDKVPDSVCLTSSGGRILYANIPAAKNMGYTVEELIGKSMAELGPKDSRGAWKKIWSEIKQKGSCLSESMHVRKDGALLPVEVMATHIFFRDREYCFVHAQDIRDRKTIEQSRIDQKNFYENILETVKDGIWVTSPQDVIIYTNKGLTEISGIPKSKIVGVHVLSGFPEETIKNFGYFYRQARKTLQPLQYEAFVVTPSKRETWQAGWLIPLVHQGRFNGMICTTQDITVQRQTQDQYSTILKTMQDGFTVLDMQGRLLDVNDAFCAMSGYSRDELLRMSIRDIDAVLTPRQIKGIISTVKNNGGTFFETRHRRRDGSMIDVEISLSSFGAGEKKIASLARDITGRKRLEDALLQSEAAARTLLNVPSTAMMLLDTKANFIEVNETMTKRFHRTREALKGMCLWDILPPHVAKLRKGYFAQVLSTTEMVRWEDERQGMWNDNSFIPITGEGGKIAYIIGFAVDITAAKRAEMLLKESEERYRKIFETCAEGILVADLETRSLKYANPAMCAMLGYTLQGLQRKSVTDIYPNEALEKVKKYSAERAGGLQPQVFDIPCRKKDGSFIYADISGTKMNIDGREYNVGFFTDRTLRREIEQQLQKSEELFRQTFERAPIGIAIFDKSGAVVNVNSFFATILGYSTDALKAQGIDVQLHTEDKQRSIKALLSSPEKLRDHAVCEKRYVACDGHTVYVKEYTQGIFSTAGELVLLIVLIEDITGRIQAEILNVNIISKMKDVYKELHDFSALLPTEQKFLNLVSIHDYNLSPMENRVASLIYHGYSNQKIASKFNISKHTVKHHITGIFSKIKVKNRLEFLKIIREKRIII